MEQLTKYIQTTTGLNAELHPGRKKIEQKLPLFIRKGFKFFEGRLHGKELTFIFPKEEIPVPKKLQHQIAKIEDVFEKNTVLILDHIEPYLRNQLLKTKIAFIVTGEQMFIPYMFLDLDERKKNKLTHVDHFYPSTQTLLIYHLWKKPLDGLNLKEIAKHFNYTAMTVTRAVRELEAAGLCTTQGGRAKVLEFENPKRKLWEQAINFLQNPVKKEFTDIQGNGSENQALAGINALAKYSNLDAGFQKTYAVKGKAVNKNEITNLAAEPGDNTLQLWNYDPAILSRDGIADPFSVWLTLQDNPDERVQMALEEMMEAVL